LFDEVGYLSYSNRHADLMFELISRRYQKTSTLVTTNRPFAEWSEVFPNAACVVSLVDHQELRPGVMAQTAAQCGVAVQRAQIAEQLAGAGEQDRDGAPRLTIGPVQRVLSNMIRRNT
jgi:IstB-like ATP binding protein